MAQHAAIAQRLGGQLVWNDWFAAASAEIALNAGRPAEAIALAQSALTSARSVGGIFAEGLARRVWGLALVAGDSPRWDEATEHLAAALQAFELGEAFLEMARTHVKWGLVCRDRGDIAAAREHFEQAAGQFEASGLAQELEHVRRLTS